MNRRSAPAKLQDNALAGHDQNPEPNAGYLRRLQQGDEVAWVQFVDEWSPRLYSYVKYNLRGADDTEDVLSEILVAVVQAVRTFDGNVTLATFIYSIAYRKVADYWRRFRVTQPWLTNRLCLGHARVSSVTFDRPPSAQSSTA